MEYIYAALLLFRAGKSVDEGSVKKILEAAGVSVDAGRVKALIAALDGVDIEKAIKEAAMAAPVAVVAPATAHAHAKEEKKEAAKPVEDAAAGLGSLFG